MRRLHFSSQVAVMYAKALLLSDHPSINPLGHEFRLNTAHVTKISRRKALKEGTSEQDGQIGWKVSNALSSPSRTAKKSSEIAYNEILKTDLNGNKRQAARSE